MKPNNVILYEGMEALKNKLGIVDSEKFISLILQEKFDYTNWQKQLWNEQTIEEIHTNATKKFKKE